MRAIRMPRGANRRFPIAAVRSAFSALLFLLLPNATLAPAHAGTITNIGTFSLPGFSTGNLGPVGNTPAPNNDNAVGASPNTIPYSIFYNAQGVGITDAEFVVANSGGTTEYRFTQSLVNNTGQVWLGFHYELGFGTGANFVRSTGLDLLDFDAPDRDPAPTSSRFSLLDHQADTLDWTGGTVPSIGSVAFSFAVDVPDDLSSFHPGGLNRFTIRQVQVTQATIIPEPSTLALLLGTGLAAMAPLGHAVLRRTRRSANLA